MERATMNGSGVAAVLVAFALLPFASARAQNSPTPTPTLTPAPAPTLTPAAAATVVRLVVVDCAAPAIDVREVERVLRATLWPALVQSTRTTADAPPPSGPALALDACQGPAGIGVQLRTADGTGTSHVLDLSDVPPSAAARTVAMALAELHDTRDGLSAGAQPPPPAPVEAPPVPAPAAAPPPPRPAPPLAEESAESAELREPREPSAYAFTGAVVAREAFAPETFLFGAAFGFERDRLHAELLAVASHADVDIGSATFGYTVLSVGYDVLRTPGSLAVALRPRFEIGVALASGSPSLSEAPNEAGVVEGSASIVPQAAGLLELDLSYTPNTDLRFSLIVGAGYALGVELTTEEPNTLGTRSFAATGGITGATALAMAWRL